MLAEHRIDDADECLIAVEQAMSPRQQITLEPSLALMLAEHGVQDATLRREKLIIVDFAGVPLTIGDLKYVAEQVRKRFVRTEDAEVALSSLRRVTSRRNLPSTIVSCALTAPGEGTETA